MSETELKNILEDKSGELLRNLISCEPEIESIQRLINKYIEEVESLSKKNIDMKSELNKIIEQYEDKATMLASLEDQVAGLESQKKSNSISKKQIVDLLQQKMKAQEAKTKDLEKKFYKEQSLDLKSFVG